MKILALRGYAIAVAAVAAALLLRELLDPVLENRYAVSTVYGAVAVAAWMGGFGPAIFATVAGYAAANFLFIDPRYTFVGWETHHLFGLGMYAISCFIIVLLGGRMRIEREKATDSHRAMALQKTQLEHTLRSISDAFYILDRNWRYVYINPQAERYFGRAKETLYGKIIWQERPALAGSRVEQEYRRAMAEQVAVHFTHLSPATGRWIEVRAYPSSEGLSIFFLDIHERKQAEDAARLAESLLRDVADAVPALISYINRDGRYVFNNRAYEDWFGMPAADAKGRHVSEVLGATTWEIVRPRLEAALRGETVRYEMELPYPSGRWRWVSAHYVPRFDNGEVEGVYTLVTDISERKKLEDDLRQSEELLRLAERAANAGSWRYDVATGRKQWSTQCHALYGTDPASFSPTLDSWAALIVDEDRPAALASVKRALSECKDLDMEFRIQHPSLGLRWLWEVGRAELEDGEPARMSGITVDITQRKEAERLLQQSEAHFRSMADTVPSMLWVSDRKGQCTYLSRQWYEFTGRRPYQDLGFGWLENLHPEDQKGTLATYLHATRNQQPFRLDYRLRRRDGEYRWMVDAGSPKFGEAGVFEGHVGCVVDVDDRKKLEQALRDADQRKDEFLALLGHELRNPLAPIRNSLGILQLAGDGDPGQRRISMEVIDRQLGNLTRLMDDLLDVGRIVSGKLELHRQRVDLRDPVRQGIETSLPGAEMMGHQIATVLPADPVYVNADAVRITQVLSNLVNNAAKFTPPGGRIEVTVERGEGVARVVVKDTGIGIPGDKLDFVFDMFVQVDGPLERHQGGLGLGLALVRRLVEMHGGSVQGRSAGAGLGSEFIVTLPLAQEDPSQLQPGKKPQATATPRRFFIVDDNKDSAESLATLLRLMGNEAATAHSGAEALQNIPAFRPDVVVCDISMPDMNGFELARRLRRESAAGGRLILVALTGFGTEADRRLAAAAGFDAHFVKPVDTKTLAAVQSRRSAERA